MVNQGVRANSGVNMAPDPTQWQRQEEVVVAVKKASAISVRISKFLYFVLGIVEVMLGFRFLFKLLGANSASGFVALLYSVTDTLLAPFSGIFGVSAANRSVIEWSIFVAMVVYWVLAIGVIQLVIILFSSPAEE